MRRHSLGILGGLGVLSLALCTFSGCDSGSGSGSSGSGLSGLGGTLSKMFKGPGGTGGTGGGGGTGGTGGGGGTGGTGGGGGTNGGGGSGGTGGSGGSTCTGACQHLVSCVQSSCAALAGATESDLASVQSECEVACQYDVTADDIAQIQAMSCGDIWSALVDVEPDLDSQCSGSYEGTGYGSTDEGYYGPDESSTDEGYYGY